jgi:hypothetical protein
VEQGYRVRDARDEPAQAGEQQQFFDLPDQDVLPRKVPETPITRSRNLGSAGIQPNSGFGDSAALGIRSSGRDACAGDTSRASAGRIALDEGVLRLVPPTLSVRFDEHVATNFA